MPGALTHETVHEDVRVPMPDGTLLYARVWRPLTPEPVPAILEYPPDRLTHRTAARDGRRHPWYAAHGYASVGVDARGHGDSEGVPGEPYGAAELADGVAVIDWLAAQPWCDGRVGMIGSSGGGYGALRIAALAPGPLKAVVTVCGTDDRYDGDVHYLGGSVLAVDTHAWAAATLALTCRPPDPLHVGDAWRDMWIGRLEAVEPPLNTWLAHQTRDEYWRRGSVREDYGAIDAAVLAVGGWHDPYRDTVLRLVEHLPADRVRGIIGSWPHPYPDHGPPGPATGVLRETLRWWDQHLRGIDTGVMGEPVLRAHVSDSHPPATAHGALSSNCRYGGVRRTSRSRIPRSRIPRPRLPHPRTSRSRTSRSRTSRSRTSRPRTSRPRTARPRTAWSKSRSRPRSSGWTVAWPPTGGVP